MKTPTKFTTKFFSCFTALGLCLSLAAVTHHAMAATPASTSRDKLGEVIEILDNTPSPAITKTAVTKTAEEISTEEMLAINRPALQPFAQNATYTTIQSTAPTVVAHDAKLALPKLGNLPLIGKIVKPTPVVQTTTITSQTVATTGINRLKIGMSNYEVMADSVMGKPKKIIRNLTKDGLSEVWEYSDNVTLTFVNNSLEKISQAEVLQ